MNEFQKAYTHALNTLARREHAVSELRRKLLRKKFSIETTESVLTELLEHSHLSDSRYAEAYIRSRKARGYGPVKIRYELIDRGVSEDVFSNLIDVHSTAWRPIAKRSYEKKYSEQLISSSLDWQKKAQFLYRRGFSSDQIQTVLEDYSH